RPLAGPAQAHQARLLGGAALAVPGGVALGAAGAGAQLVPAAEGAAARRRPAGASRRDAQAGAGAVPRRPPRWTVPPRSAVSEPSGRQRRAGRRGRLTGLTNERRVRRRSQRHRLGRATFGIPLLVPARSIQLSIEGPRRRRSA